MNLVTLLLIATILLIVSIGLFMAFEDDKLGIIVVGMLCFVVGITLWTYCFHTKGVKDGAYNQLRGKYEISYIIDKDSCITDTIINIK